MIDPLMEPTAPGPTQDAGRWSSYVQALAACPIPGWIEASDEVGCPRVEYLNQAAKKWLGSEPASILLQYSASGEVSGARSIFTSGQRFSTTRSALEEDASAHIVWLVGHEGETFRRMLDVQPELLVRCDLEGYVLYANPAFLKHFELASSAAMEPSLPALFGVNVWASIVAARGALSVQRPALDASFEIETRGTCYSKWRLFGIFDDHGALAELMAVGRDITVEKRKELALGDALGEVEQLTRQLESERRYLREEIDAMTRGGGVIAETPSMRRIIEQVMTVARTDSTVLLLGETGTGKEVIARMLHQSSSRAAHPLVKVNCAALPSALVESELFGHERGAFTGAVNRRQGRFEVADRGTLFLDEVGEIPLDTQAKLLRVLQEHEFERVGSNKAIRVDVRVVAATNRDLKAEVAAGRFRSDLYYRLAVFPLRLPPLRERTGDIPLLAEHFLQRSCRERARKGCRGFTPEALEWLNRYSWPGNVRELQSVIERAIILLQGEFVDVSLLQQTGGLLDAAKTLAPPAMAKPNAEAEALVTLEEMERRYIARVLSECDARVEGEDGAAAILGLPPSTLRSRMRKLGIKRSS